MSQIIQKLIHRFRRNHLQANDGAQTGRSTETVEKTAAWYKITTGDPFLSMMPDFPSSCRTFSPSGVGDLSGIGRWWGSPVAKHCFIRSTMLHGSIHGGILP